MQLLYCDKSGVTYWSDVCYESSERAISVKVHKRNDASSTESTESKLQTDLASCSATELSSAHNTHRTHTIENFPRKRKKKQKKSVEKNTHMT